MEQKIKILIVEDEAICVMSLRRVLTRAGYYVCEPVSTGKKAVKRAKQEKADLVIMDVFLKGEMDGIEAAMGIRSLYDIPIIFVSGYPEKELSKWIKSVERSILLPKPFVPEELLLAINQSLQK